MCRYLLPIAFVVTAMPWARVAAAEISAELVPGVTGHPSYMTHSYSWPLVIRNRHVFLAYLEDDSRTSTSVIQRSPGGEWSHPLRLGGGRRYDGHYYPNLVVDKNGFFHAFYGCHGDRLRYRRSTRAGDISEWEPESFPYNSATYPRPFVLSSGEIVVFFRTQLNRELRYGYLTSRDGGKSWSSLKSVIDCPRRAWSPYVGGVSIVEQHDRPVVHISWSWYDMGKKTNPFSYDDPVHVSFELGANQWQGQDETTGQLPVAYKSVQPILRRERAYVEDSTVDSFGRPHLLISEYGITAEQKKSARTLLAVFEDGVWRLEEPQPRLKFPVGGARIVAAAGWTAMVGLTAEHGLVIAQRRDGESDFLIRPIQRMPGFTPVHPVVVADEAEQRFHVVATGYRAGQPGSLLYATTSLEP